MDGIARCRALEGASRHRRFAIALTLRAAVTTLLGDLTEDVRVSVRFLIDLWRGGTLARGIDDLQASIMGTIVMRRWLATGLAGLIVIWLSACTPGLPSPTGPTPGPIVRVLYVRPSDRPYNSAYSDAITNAVTTVQSWYRDQLGGTSFSLAASQPQACVLPQPSSYYTTGSWDKVFSDVQPCAPVTYASATTTWLLYVDVLDTPCTDPGRLGAGTLGLTMLPRADLEGLIGHTAYDACGGAYTAPVGRWIGGLGHELGHAFGLPHPPGCDTGQPTCDSGALMWSGYGAFPSTYLRDSDKNTLRTSPFFYS